MKIIKHRTVIVFALALMLVGIWGCEDKEDVTNITMEMNEDAEVEVTARVLSYPAGIALSGAEYTLIHNGATGASDADGYFQLNGLAPGSYQLLLSAVGYAPVRVALTLNPQNLKATNYSTHLDLRMIETTGSAQMTVFAAPEGTPLANAEVEVVGAGYPYGYYYHTIESSALPEPAMTDSNGVVEFSNLPATGVTIAVSAHDVDGDGVPEYGALMEHFSLQSGVTEERVVVLVPYEGQDVEVVYTDLPYYGNRFMGTVASIVYSSPMNTAPGHFDVQMTHDNYPYDEVAVTGTWTSPIRLEIEPQEVLSDPNRDYNINITAESEGGVVVQYSTRLYWVNSAGGAPGGDCEDVVTDLALGYSSENIDFATTGVWLTWSAVGCAGGYKIYGKDDRNNMSWVHLRDENTDYETGAITAFCDLPSTFDRYQVDGFMTPFAGTTVSFCVVPLRAVDTSPGDAHAILDVVDNVMPGIMDVVQTGDGINDTGQPGIIAFKVIFSEYVHPATNDPIILFEENGGDPDFILDPADGSWEWENGRRQGTFTFPLGDGQDASGDSYRVRIIDIQDLSGNLVSGQTQVWWKDIEAWGSEYDFETSNQGWTRSGEGWAWGSPSIGPGSGHASVNCWGVTLDVQHGDNWDTEVVSPIIYVPAVAPTLEFWSWYELDYYDDYVYVYVDHDGGSTLLTSFNNDVESWQLREYGLYSFANQHVRIRFQFTSDNYGTYDGFFFDDLRVYSNTK